MTALAAQPPRSPSDRDALALIGLPMVRRIARAHGRRFPQLADEFESAAYLGLAQAIDRFDPAQGAPFAAFAARRIWGAVLDTHRQSNSIGYSRRKHSGPKIVSLDAPYDETSKRPIKLADILPADEEGPDTPSALDTAQDLCQTLTAAQKMIVCRMYGYAATNTMKKVGLHFRLDESRISHLLGEAIKQLQRDLCPSARRGGVA